MAIPISTQRRPRPPFYLCAASEEALWQGLQLAGLSDLQFPQLDVIGSLFVPTGLVLADEQDHRFPHFGLYRAITQRFTRISQRASAQCYLLCLGRQRLSESAPKFSTAGISQSN
ncbi:MAG: hypothetical protein EBR85_03920 [Betaproteobacteria bacterium]|nr:hypothetical protein [Betaproteobacteria bacterium]